MPVVPLRVRHKKMFTSNFLTGSVWAANISMDEIPTLGLTILCRFHQNPLDTPRDLPSWDSVEVISIQLFNWDSVEVISIQLFNWDSVEVISIQLFNWDSVETISIQLFKWVQLKLFQFNFSSEFSCDCLSANSEKKYFIINVFHKSWTKGLWGWGV